MAILDFTRCCPVTAAPCTPTVANVLNATWTLNNLCTSGLFAINSDLEGGFCEPYIPFGATEAETMQNFVTQFFGETFAPYITVSGATVSISISKAQYIELSGASEAQADSVFATFCAGLTYTACTSGAEPGCGANFGVTFVPDCQCVEPQNCLEVPYRTLRVSFDLADIWQPDTAFGETLNLRLSCLDGITCSGADWLGAGVGTWQGTLAATVASFATVLNELPPDSFGTTYKALASGTELTVDVIFEDDNVFAYYCETCLSALVICLQEIYAVRGGDNDGQLLIRYNSVSAGYKVCGCGESPEIVCAPTEDYCLPIIPGDRLQFATQLVNTNFVRGVYRVDLCEGCDTVTEGIGKATVTFGQWAYIDITMPLTVADGCYSLCIKGNTYAPPPAPNPACDNQCVLDWEVSGDMCQYMVTLAKAVEAYYNEFGVLPPASYFEPANLPPTQTCYDVTTPVYHGDFLPACNTVDGLTVALYPKAPNANALHSYTLHAGYTSGGVFAWGVIRSANPGISISVISNDAECLGGVITFVAGTNPGDTLVIEGQPCTYDCSGGVAELPDNIFPYSDSGTFENALIALNGVITQQAYFYLRYTDGASLGNQARTGIGSLHIVPQTPARPPNVLVWQPIALQAGNTYEFEVYAKSILAWAPGPIMEFAWANQPAQWQVTNIGASSLDGTPGGYIRFAIRIVCNAVSGNINVGFRFVGEPDTFALFFDDASLVVIPPPPPPPPASLAFETYCSGCVRVTRDGCYTSMVRISNNGNGLGIPYGTLPKNYQEFRVEATIRNVQYGADRSVYNTSSGQTIKVYSRVQRTYDLETGYLPANMHETLALGLEHDTFELRPYGQDVYTRFATQSDYEIAEINRRIEPTLRKASANLIETPYDKTNSQC